MLFPALLAGLLAAAAGHRGAFLRRSALRNSHTQHAALQSKTMAALYPFYHTTQGISDELTRLASACPGMALESRTEVGDSGARRSVDVVTIKASGPEPVNKNFLLFGEHSRELVSPESGLHLVRTLCGETGLSDRAKDILKDSEFQIVVNGNPESRQKVEQGDFCLRVDPEGVDLNRNWDEEWKPEAVLDSADTNPGPKAFSEPETRIFRKLVEDYRPTNFLTVHSGTKGMYMPWAYDMEHLASRNQPQMMKILKDLDARHCECPFGAAGHEVGYSCPGTCLDWVYDKLQTPYAFAFEIYVGTEYAGMLKERWEEKMKSGVGAFYQRHSHLGHPHFKDLFEAHPSGFVQLRSEHLRGFQRTSEECFSQFNPSSEEELNEVVENWSAAYLDLAEMVASDLKRGGGSGGAGNATLLSLGPDGCC